MEVEGEVEVEEGGGRIEYKVVVEQLKRSSSKHRPNYLVPYFLYKSYKMFRDFFLFLFLFLKGEEGKNISSTQLVVNIDIFQGGERNSTTTYTRICMLSITVAVQEEEEVVSYGSHRRK